MGPRREVKNSTFTDKFKAAYPDRFVDCYIAEQNMAGVALGLASEGKIPFASTFACFLTRAFDQIRMAGISKPAHLVFVGHPRRRLDRRGRRVADGPRGPVDVPVGDRLDRCSTRATPVSAERVTALAAATPGIVYLRMSRPKTKTLYTAQDKFVVGGSKTLRASQKDVATVVAAGVTVAEALKAYDLLQKEGILDPRHRRLQRQAASTRRRCGSRRARRRS
jgi:transketolase